MGKLTLLLLFSSVLSGCPRLLEPCLANNDTACVVAGESWEDEDNGSAPSTEPRTEEPGEPNIVVSLRQDLVHLTVAPGTNITLLCVDVTVNHTFTHIVELNGWVRSDEANIEQLKLTMSGFEWFIDLAPVDGDGSFQFDTADNAGLEPGTTTTFCVVADQFVLASEPETCINSLMLQDAIGNQSLLELNEELCTTVSIQEPVTVTVSLSVDMPLNVPPGLDRQLVCFDFEAHGGAVNLNRLFGRILTQQEQASQPENIKLLVRHGHLLINQGEIDGENFSFNVDEGDLTIADLTQKTVCMQADVVEGQYMTCLNGFEFTDLTTNEQVEVQLGTPNEPIPCHNIIVE